MRAAFAGYVFELIGCDTMHNADKFARFPTTSDMVDCRIDVTVQGERLYPQGEPLSQHGNWRCYPHGEHKRYYRRDARLMIEVTDDFSWAHLMFCDDMPTLDIMVYLTVQQTIHSFLLLHDTALIHSAGLCLDNKGVLLCGRSGVGKSTMAAHLQALGSPISVLSEDMPALRKTDDCLMIGGTPLCGDDEQCENTTAPLSHIVFLRQAKDNRLTALSGAEAVYELLTVLPRVVYEPQVGTVATDWCVMLADKISPVVFENDGTEQAARMLLEYLQKEPREQL